MKEASQDCVEIGVQDSLDSDQSEFELQKEDYQLLEQLHGGSATGSSRVRGM